MLILSRKKEESMIIAGNIEIRVLDIVNGSVKLGIVAPKEVQVHRKEVYDRIKLENKESADANKSLQKLIEKKNKL